MPRSPPCLLNNLSDHKNPSHTHQSPKINLFYRQIQSIQHYKSQLHNCQFNPKDYDLHCHRKFLQQELNISLYLLYNMVDTIHQYDNHISTLNQQLKDYETKANMLDSLSANGKNLTFKKDSHSPSQKKRNQAFEAEIEILFAKLKNQEKQELSKLKEQINQLESEIREREQQIDGLIAKNKQIQHQNSNLMEENRMLRNQLYIKINKESRSSKKEQARFEQPELVIHERKLNNLNFSPIDHREIAHDDISFHNNDYFEDNTESKLLKETVEQLQLKLREEIQKGVKIMEEHEFIEAKMDQMEQQLQQAELMKQKWDETEQNYINIKQELSSKLNQLQILRKTVVKFVANEQQLKKEITKLKSQLGIQQQSIKKEQKIYSCENCLILQQQKHKLSQQLTKITAQNNLMKTKIKQTIQFENKQHKSWEEMLFTINDTH